MPGRVIHGLRGSRLAPVLNEDELHVLAGCGRFERREAGDPIVAADGHDERMFVLQDGAVELGISMWSQGGHCGGDANFVLDRPGEPFGWARWVRPDSIAVAARALRATTVIALDLGHLDDGAVLLNLSHRMVQLLYARLQEGGVCPPDVQGLLKWQHVPHAVAPA